MLKKHLFIFCGSFFDSPPIPGVNVKIPFRGGNILKKKQRFLSLLKLCGDCLGFVVLNGPPPHPHPWRQCQSSLPGEKILETFLLIVLMTFRKQIEKIMKMVLN